MAFVGNDRGPPVIDEIEVKFYFVRNAKQTTSNPIEATVVLHARRVAGRTPPVRQNYNGPQKLDSSLSYNSVSGSLEIGEGKYEDTEREEAI